MHPIIKILYFLLTLLLVSFLSNSLIWLLCILLVTCAAKLNFEKFLRVVKRTKWLFISILIIYAFSTPGEYIQGFSTGFAPTYEGLNLGFLQVAKLLIALAALNILFATSTIENLMAGLYTLLSPLQLLGFNVERFTARLMLTLDYVEDLLVKNNYKFNFHQLDDIYTTPEDTCTEKEIVLVLPPFKLMDKLLLVVFIGIVIGLLLYRVLL